MSYKFLPHTADIKIQADGKSLEEAFKSSAQALKETIAGKIKIKEEIKKQIKAEGNDLESLLYSFLEEFLYLLDAEDFILSKIINLKISPQKITPHKSEFRLINKKINNKSEQGKHYHAEGIITGDKASNYRFSNDVKAITYNNMFVKKEKNKFICQFVLDV